MRRVARAVSCALLWTAAGMVIVAGYLYEDER